jgi:hypothetical protein
MWIAAKESLDLPGDFHLRGRPYPQFCIEAYLVFSSQDRNYWKITEKMPKGIDKMNIGFIIRLWGKVVKRGGQGWTRVDRGGTDKTGESCGEPGETTCSTVGINIRLTKKEEYLCRQCSGSN